MLDKARRRAARPLQAIPATRPVPVAVATRYPNGWLGQLMQPAPKIVRAVSPVPHRGRIRLFNT